MMDRRSIVRRLIVTSVSRSHLAWAQRHIDARDAKADAAPRLGDDAMSLASRRARVGGVGGAGGVRLRDDEELGARGHGERGRARWGISGDRRRARRS